MYRDVDRRLLPLILSWAVLVHNLQCTTPDNAIINLGKKHFAKGQVYVTLSRVKTLKWDRLGATLILRQKESLRSVHKRAYARTYLKKWLGCIVVGARTNSHPIREFAGSKPATATQSPPTTNQDTFVTDKNRWIFPCSSHTCITAIW